MKNKRLISLILALVIVFSSVGNVFAATFDLYHKIENNDDVDLYYFLKDPIVFRKVYYDVENYLQKHLDGKYYSFKEIDEEMQKGAFDTSEAIKNLEPYILIQEGQGATIIDSALTENQAEYDESKYTPESWAKYLEARSQLESIKNNRFEKESIINEKIAKLQELKEDLDLLPTIDLTELREVVEEGENMDLSGYTPESASAFRDALASGRAILENPENVDEAQVAQAISNIREKKALLETNYALEVESIISPATITVIVADLSSEEPTEILLPETVVAVMTDKSHKDVSVQWAESINNENEGTFQVPGTAEGKETAQKIIVVDRENFVDKTHLAEAINRGQRASESKYTPVSYRELREALESGILVNDNPDATEEEVYQATERILDALFNLVEQSETDRIVYVENPAKITVELNESVVMPEMVNVVLNSGAKVQKQVIWTPSTIDTTTLGTKTAEGRVEETNLRATFTVEVKEDVPQVEKAELREAIRKGEEVNRDLYTPESLAKMDQALSWAKRIEQMESATQDSVNSAKDTLNTAIDGLEEKAEVPQLTNIKPDVDQNVKAGDEVLISFNGPENGSAGYKIALPGSVNNSVITPNMVEKTPGYYEAMWQVPEGFNGRGMLIFVSFTDSNGTNAFGVAEGKINITQNFVITYQLETGDITEEVSRGNKPVNLPSESDKEGYIINSWTLDGNTIDPKEVVIHEDKTFIAVYNKDHAQWAKVKFQLTDGVEFVENAITEYEILKAKTPSEQGVSIPAHKEETVPAGKKVVWDLDLNEKINGDTIYTATLVKDEGQFKIITVEPLENGSLVNPESSTFEVLNTTEDEDIITKAKSLVKADEFYILDEAKLQGNTVKISFKKDPSKWVDIKFVKVNEVISQHNVHVGQTYENAGITPPSIDAPVGQKLIWTPEFYKDAQIEKPADSNEIIYSGSFVEDDSQYTTIIISVGENGKLVDESQNVLKVLKTATWADVKEKAIDKVGANDNYIFDKFTIDEVAIQDADLIVENGNYKAQFIKDPDKWIDVTFKAGEKIKLKLAGETQTSDIILNIPKGTSFSQGIENIEVIAETGYLFDKWTPEVQIINGDTTEFTAQSKKDPIGWSTIKFVAGENGDFEEEVEDQEVLTGTEWSEITVPTPKANKGYVFDKWEPEFPKDTVEIFKDDEGVEHEVVIPAKVTSSKTYTAKFRALDNLTYDIKLIQVDEEGNVINDGYGKPVEIKPTETVDRQVYGDVVTVNAPTLNNFDLVGEGIKSITIKLENSENKVVFTYKAKDDAVEIAKGEMASQAEDGVGNVSSGNDDISFSFDKENRIIYFNFANPEGNAIEDLYSALGGSGIFPAIASVENMQSVSFAGAKINFYDEGGERKTPDAIKTEMIQNLAKIIEAFNLPDDFDEESTNFIAQWHGVNAKPVADGQSQGEEKIWFSDTYTFMFRVTDRDVIFDGNAEGTFDGENTKTITRPFKGVLGETPLFQANSGYILDKYSVTYKDVEDDTWKVKNEEVAPSDLSTFNVYHNMVIKPIVVIDESQTLPYTIKYFIDGEEQTDLAENKTVTVADPKVKTVEDKIPENYIVDSENTNEVSEQNPFTVTEDNNVIERYYVKDSSKWVKVKFSKDGTTLDEYEVHVGQTYKDAGITPPTVEVPGGQKLVWTPVFDENKQIEKPVDGNEIVYNASFEKDSSKVEVIFKKSRWQKIEEGEESEDKFFITKGETLGVGITNYTNITSITPLYKHDYLLGWYNGDTKVEEDFVVTEDITLMPKFERKFYLNLSDPKTLGDLNKIYNDKFVVDLLEDEEVKILKTHVVGYLPYEYKESSHNDGWKNIFNPDEISVGVRPNDDYAFVQFYATHNDKYTLTFVTGENGKVEGESQVIREVYAGHSLGKQEVAIPTPTPNPGYKLGPTNWTPDITEESVFNENTTFNANIVLDETQTMPYIVRYFVDGVEKVDWKEEKVAHLSNPTISEVTDNMPEGYKIDETNSTPLPYSVSAENNEIKIYYVMGDINITFEVIGENGSLSSVETISIPAGTTWGEVKTQFPRATTSEGYLTEWNPEFPTEDSYIFNQNVDYKVSFRKFTYTLGDEQIEGKNIVNREYKDNSVKNAPIGEVQILDGNIDVTNKFNSIKYYDRKDGNEITTFDFGKGGQTFSAYMVATSETHPKAEGEVFFKYGSVTIGKESEEYLTIEDALKKASSGQQIVAKYNTSFAKSDVAEKLYGTSTHTIPSGVTLLLPFDETYSDNLEDKSSGQNGTPITRNSPFITANMPDGINLNIEGTVTLNAKTSGGTSYGAGTVYKDYYSQLEMGSNTKINVKSGGRLNSLGFVIGNGSVEMESGSEALDLLMMHDYRGGTETGNIYTKIFPLDQFSMNNIEVPFRIHSGSKYKARTHVIAGINVVPTVGVVGGSESLLNLSSGYIDKTYNIGNGKVTFDVNGNTEINNISIDLGKFFFFNVVATTEGKEIPFCGLFNINLKSGAQLSTNANAKILPAMNFTIEEGATMNIGQNSHIFIYDGTNYTGPNSKWGTYIISKAADKYRVAPTFGINKTMPGKLIVNGTLNVFGNIGGEVVKGSTGQINFNEGSGKSVTIKHLFMEARPMPEITSDFKEVNQ